MDMPHPPVSRMPMRRKDREITDAAEINAILQAGQVMYLGLARSNQSFVVPLYYAVDGPHVYFHSAKAGTKVGMLHDNPQVCFVVSLDQGVIPDEKPCDFEARHRTVMGFGAAEFVEDNAEKTKALNMIVARFTDVDFQFPQANLDRTLVVKIAVERLSGKKHGF